MPLLGIYPKKTASLTQKDGCTPTSTAVSPTTAEIRSSPDSDRLRKRDTSEGDVEQNPATWNKIVCIDLEGIVRSAMNQINTLLFCVESQQTNNSTGRLETTDAMARGVVGGGGQTWPKGVKKRQLPAIKLQRPAEDGVTLGR